MDSQNQKRTPSQTVRRFPEDMEDSTGLLNGSTDSKDAASPQMTPTSALRVKQRLYAERDKELQALQERVAHLEGELVTAGQVCKRSGRIKNNKAQCPLTAHSRQAGLGLLQQSEVISIALTAITTSPSHYMDSWTPRSNGDDH